MSPNEQCTFTLSVEAVSAKAKNAGKKSSVRPYEASNEPS